MCDRGGWKLFSTESFGANADRIPLPDPQSIVLAATSSNPASSEDEARAFWAETPKCVPAEHQTTPGALLLLQQLARSTNQDASTFFPSLEQTRLPPERPTVVPTCGESQVPAIFQTRPQRGTGSAGHVRQACGAETEHVKPPLLRHTACAPPRQPTRPGARHPRARTSQRNTLDSRRSGRCGGNVRRARRAEIPFAWPHPSPRAALTLPRAPDAARWGEKKK